jgi:HK97 gp10 family phage protein
MTKQGHIKWYGDRLLAEIKDATPDALFEAGEQLVNAAAAKAPRATGDLAASGYVTSEKRSTYRRAANHRKEVKVQPGQVGVGFAAFYARFIELGTKRKAARPYLRPALDELAGQLGATIADHVRRKVDK